MFLLALIGLITLLWLLRKFLNKIGDLLNKAGDFVADLTSISQVRTEPSQYQSEKIKEKIHAIKGNGTDEQYWKDVRSQIDDLTKE